MQMQALKANRYGNRQRQAGDRFEVRAEDVKLVKALGWAREAPPIEALPTAKRTYTRKVVQAEASVPAPAEPDAPDEGHAEGHAEPEPEPVLRTYHRRDLVAEGE